MIDVVFLLLVFFMLASRFGADMTLPLALAGSGGETRYAGAPRVVDVLPAGVRLNGSPIADADLATAIAPLLEAPDDVIVIRARDGAVLQRMVDTVVALETAGFETFAIVE